MQTSSVGSVPGLNRSGRFDRLEKMRTELARHGRRAEDGRDGKDASRIRREHEAGNQGTGFRSQTSVDSQGSLQQERVAAFAACPTERSESRPAKAEHERG